MDNKHAQLLITRIERFADRIARSILGQVVTFNAEYAVSEEPVPFADRQGGAFRPISEGETWGRTWASGWFHLTAEVPASWAGKTVVAQLDFGGEGLVFESDGFIRQGISNGSVFQADFSRDIVRLYDRCDGGETVDWWVETAASGLFGMFTEPDPDLKSTGRYGRYDAAVRAMRLCVFDDDLWHLWLDLRILRGLIKRLPETGVQRARLIRAASDAISAYADNRANLELCRDILHRELDKQASASTLTVTAVGHAHIDTAWLWPVSETIRKCARTFASQLDLLERYPEYVFGASQPQHYEFVRQHYPELYERIRAAVKEGRWEPQGGMWVEADCNLISGESMVRQILHGKNFFKNEFGWDVDNLWLPDVFGYSAAMPQILLKSGIKYFLTQKISWNQFNEFPHHTFMWRGIDGSEVLTHFPPENNYNSQLDTDYLIPAQEHFKEKDYLDEFISLFGVGDGGGGPKEENIETGRRMKNLEGAPRVRFGSACDFFERLAASEDLLPAWVGELYLELHRGTLTTQAIVKKANRKLEHRLRELEMMWSCLSPADYPLKEIDAIWKTVLINQFHDIIPGSSITRTYQVTHAEHRKALEDCAALRERAARQLFAPDPESLVVMNTLPYDLEQPVSLPGPWNNATLDGQMLPAQRESDSVTVLLAVPAYSFVTLRRSDEPAEAGRPSKGLILENDLVRYEFATDGTLTSARDVQSGRDIMAPGHKGNVLTLYDDHPNDWDAWDIDLFYEESIVEVARSVSVDPLPCGPVRQGL
ncbi:MAG: alpha-mannosidase 2c1, partial [candidate division Zixibacteria bacterium]|nr:alpha-mannosidase 2c1 [candidate division Zixibacteria bacterium]